MSRAQQRQRGWLLAAAGWIEVALAALGRAEAALERADGAAADRLREARAELAQQAYEQQWWTRRALLTLEALDNRRVRASDTDPSSDPDELLPAAAESE